MAGSYKHVVDEEGKLLNTWDMAEMIENSGDVFEAIEEMYGMIWYLARLAVGPTAAAGVVEVSRLKYKEGLKASPGTDGELPEEE